MLQKNKAGEEVDEEKKSLLTLLVQNVLRNPYIWGMVSPTAASKSEDPIYTTEGCYCGVLFRIPLKLATWDSPSVAVYIMWLPIQSVFSCCRR